MKFTKKQKIVFAKITNKEMRRKKKKKDLKKNNVQTAMNTQMLLKLNNNIEKRKL